MQQTAYGFVHPLMILAISSGEHPTALASVA